MSERYLNPFVDYGFKKLFGTEENKDLLISFLNALIGGENPIKNLYYKNVERIGEFVGTRTNYFDVYCQTASGEEIIVEMQNTWQPYFKDRMLYYAAKPIRDQVKKGVKNWEFYLKDVYVVAMMNFELPAKEYPKDSFLHKVQLMDVEDHHVFYDKLTLIYVELPKLDNVTPDLATPLGRWLHALNNLYYYDKKPSELKEPVFDKLFHQAELAQFTPEQDLAYERSMKVYLDTYNQLRGAHILGVAEGKEQGLAEGERRAKLETARKLLEMGIDRETVCKATGLSETTIIEIIQ